MKNKIVLYNDSKIFGGHEVMSLEITDILCKNNFQVSYICSSQNKKLIQEINQLKKNNLEIIIFSYSSGFLSLKSIISFRSCLKLARLFKSLNPDLIILIQGRIEISSLGILACDLCGLNFASYLPIAHSLSIASRKPFTGIRDILGKILYQKIYSYITVSNTIKSDIENWNQKASVFVLQNCINIDRYSFFDKVESKGKFGFSELDLVLGMVGRIDFLQKGHDFVIKNFKDLRKVLPNAKLLIVGEGQDDNKLAQIIIENQLEDFIVKIPWQSNLSEVYSALDILVLASKYEGFPIVIIEAMLYLIPILASDISEFKDLLPKEWLYKFNDRNNFIYRAKNMSINPENSKIMSHKELVMQNYNKDTFEGKLIQIVNDLL